MSYNSQTPNLGLPQWILSNPPQMSDFNTAFSLVDNFAGEVNQDLKTLTFSKGSTYTIGEYISTGYVTTGGDEFDCYIYLPKLVDTNVSTVTVNGNVKIRQSGNYIIGTGSSSENLTDLTVAAILNTGRCGIKIQITSGISSAENNAAAAALFGNLSISFN